MFLRCLLFVLISAPAFASPLPNPSVPAEASKQAVDVSLRPVARVMELPNARWGDDGGRRSWTVAALQALRGHARNLPDIVPRDIAAWCPAYPSADRPQREAFWVGLVSTLVKHESTYRPTAVGGGGKWYGLTQILPATARGYKCQARSGTALKNPTANLSCAYRIMAVTVDRDRVVSKGMRGVAADWGPFHSRKKRTDMMAWTRKQDYCAGMTRSLRPIARPAELEVRQSIPPQMTPLRPTARPRVLEFSDARDSLETIPVFRP